MEQLALKLRREWGIDNYAPIDIFSIVLGSITNLTLLWLEMDENISGCCAKTEEDFLILINSNHTKGRQNFTLAHELYHLKFDKTTNASFCNVNSKNINEIKANKFASYLLMPSCALEEYKDKNNIVKWSLKDIIRCEQYFKISHHFLLIRLLEENFINKEEFEDYQYGVKSFARTLGFDTSLYEISPKDKKHYVLGNLIPLTEELYEKNLISKGLRNEIFINNFRSDLVYVLEEEIELLMK